MRRKLLTRHCPPLPRFRVERLSLDGSGRGRISHVIAALGYVVAQKDALNIRIANLSIAAGVYESFNWDPLTLATKQLVRAGIVVVAAAGNNGRNPNGREHYGGITAPGNAPWVLTVGASSHMGTIARADESGTTSVCTSDWRWARSNGSSGAAGETAGLSTHGDAR